MIDMIIKYMKKNDGIGYMHFGLANLSIDVSAQSESAWAVEIKCDHNYLSTEWLKAPVLNKNQANALANRLMQIIKNESESIGMIIKEIDLNAEIEMASKIK